MISVGFICKKRGTSPIDLKNVVRPLLICSGGQIKEIAGVTRSALTNYVTGANQISKRGQDALKKLIARFNSEVSGEQNSAAETCINNIKFFSDRELLEELKNRGFNVFVSV